jgi:tetratricopeptide (TPR) repeat protein
VAGRLDISRTDYDQAVAHFGESLRILDTFPPMSRAREKRPAALLGLGAVARLRGETECAAAYFEEALTHFRAAADNEGIASTLWQMAAMAAPLGDGERSRLYAMESLKIFTEMGAMGGVSAALQTLSYAHYVEGDLEAADYWAREGLAASMQAGDNFRAMQMVALLGEFRYLMGDFPGARERYEESRLMALRYDSAMHVARMLYYRAFVEHQAGEDRLALDLLLESLPVCRGFEGETDVALCLLGLGGVAVTQGRPHLAARLLSVAERILAPPGSLNWPSHRFVLGSYVGAAKAQLSPSEWEEAWREGRGLTLDEAVSCALALGARQEAMPS